MSDFGEHPGLQKFAPKIGVLKLCHGHGAPLGRTHIAGFGYQVVERNVPGLNLRNISRPSPQVLANLKQVVAELVALGVKGIGGDSYQMWPLQEVVSGMVEVPVVMSAMVQIAMLVPAFDMDQKFLIVTNHYEQLKVQLDSVLWSRGLHFASSRFIVVELLHGELESPDRLGDRIKEKAEEDPSIAGVVIDNAALLSHADSIRATTSFPVFDHVTCLDYIISATSDNPYFGTCYECGTADENSFVKANRRLFSPSKEYLRKLRSQVNGDMKVGVLRIDYDYPPIPGDVDSTASYGYDVVFAKMEGLTFEKAQRAENGDQIESSIQKAVRELEAQNVVAITGDCGFLMAYQKYVRSLTKLPVILSSIVQAPMMVAAHGSRARFAVLTANSKTFDKKSLLLQSGVSINPDNWVLVGLQDVPGFEAVALGKKVPAEKVQPAIAAMCKDLKAKHPKLRGFLLECTELPHYADEIRYRTGLPVFDAITALDFFQTSCYAPPCFVRTVLDGFIGAMDVHVQMSAIAQINASIMGSVGKLPCAAKSSYNACCALM